MQQNCGRVSVAFEIQESPRKGTPSRIFSGFHFNWKWVFWNLPKKYQGTLVSQLTCPKAKARECCSINFGKTTRFFLLHALSFFPNHKGPVASSRVVWTPKRGLIPRKRKNLRVKCVIMNWAGFYSSQSLSWKVQNFLCRARFVSADDVRYLRQRWQFKRQSETTRIKKLVPKK